MQGGAVAGTPAGEFDYQISLLSRFQIRPWDIHKCDPDFLEELLAYGQAEDQKQKADERKARTKAIAARAKGSAPGGPGGRRPPRRRR